MRTSHSRTTVGPPWSSGTQVVRTGEHRHEPAEQPSRARTLPGLGPRQLRPPRARPAPTGSAPPGVVAGPGGTPAGSRGSASPAAPVRRRGRGARRCPDSRRDLARRRSRRRPRAGAHPAPACKTDANESTGTGTRTRTGPVMRTTTNPRSGARPQLRAGADPAGETRSQGGSRAGEVPGPGRIRGRGGSGVGLRNFMSAQRNSGAGSSAGRGGLA